MTRRASAAITSEDQLEDALSAPPPSVVEMARGFEGDLLVLGVGGKMGPSLARMALRALRAAGQTGRVIGVSRFADGDLRGRLEGWGIDTIACDLLDGEALRRLPPCPNVIYMPARKFGSAAGAEPETWATNAYLAGEAAAVFRNARIVAFSTGNVYPLWPLPVGPSPSGQTLGPTEDSPTGPVGEYAQSCVARERLFEFFSRRHGTRVTLLRLNYAVELRYGVLVDIATKIMAGTPIDLRMGSFNLVWQGDANAYALLSFGLAASPPAVLNLTGPLVRTREVAERLGAALGRAPILEGTEEATALISNPDKCFALYGPPKVPLETMITWVAGWLTSGGRTLGKPTKFQVRDGRF